MFIVFEKSVQKFDLVIAENIESDMFEKVIGVSFNVTN